MKDVDSYIPLFCVCAAEKKKMGRKAPSSPVVVLSSAFILFFFLPFIHVFFRPV